MLNKLRLLDFNKYFVCDFDYKYIRTKYNNHGKLLFIDTNSLVYEI